jgi:hypothetical protein
MEGLVLEIGRLTAVEEMTRPQSRMRERCRQTQWGFLTDATRAICRRERYAQHFEQRSLESPRPRLVPLIVRHSATVYGVSRRGNTVSPPRNHTHFRPPILRPERNERG